MVRLTGWLGLLLVALFLSSCGMPSSTARSDGKPVKPVKQWEGRFPAKEDEALRAEAPARGYLTNQQAWSKLWRAWRGQEDLPQVEFEKQLVLVGTAECARNRVQAEFSLDDKGDLKGGFLQTLIGGPGFAYLIVVVDRAGVKTYNGKAIEKE
jgi:hypothetical protein